MRVKHLFCLLFSTPSLAFQKNMCLSSKRQAQQIGRATFSTIQRVRDERKKDLLRKGRLEAFDFPFENYTIEKCKPTNAKKIVSSIVIPALIPAVILFGVLNSQAWALDADPKIESEVLSDMSHVALDFLSLLNPDTLVLRAASVVGRLLFIASDFVLDRKISPDDLIFQSGTLTASTILLAKSTVPLIASWLTEEYNTVTFRDRRAYQTMFRPVGVSWLQYRILFGTGAMEWTDHMPSSTILSTSSSGDEKIYQEEQHHVHWLYQGNAEVKYYGSSETVQYLDMRQGKSLNSPNDMGLLTDTKFIELLQEKTRKRSKKLNPDTPSENSMHTNWPRAPTVTIGSKGATVLKINMVKLIQLMKDDQKLDTSLRSLFLKGMHRKLSALLSAKLQKSHNVSIESV